MKSPIAIFLITTLILSSCGPVAVVPTEVQKTPFFIETYIIGQTQAPISIEKTGRITASSSLTLSAQ